MQLLLVLTLLCVLVATSHAAACAAESLQPVGAFAAVGLVVVVVSLLLLPLKSPEIEEQSSDSALSILILILTSMQEAALAGNKARYKHVHFGFCSLFLQHSGCRQQSYGNTCL